jgi:dTDP-L-rhamnose 4-epimerase
VILAVFSNLARVGSEINVFEDGNESRDFVYISDVVKATIAAIEMPLTGSHSVNVGSGASISVIEIATLIRDILHSESKIQVSGDFRKGDIRHGIADLQRAGKVLQYEPQVSFEEGLGKFLHWASENDPGEDRYKFSLREMENHGMFHARSAIKR